MPKKKATKEQLESHLVNMLAYKQTISDYIKGLKTTVRDMSKTGQLQTEPPNPPKNPPFP